MTDDVERLVKLSSLRVRGRAGTGLMMGVVQFRFCGCGFDGAVGGGLAGARRRVGALWVGGPPQ
jgi:hypothetical protein